MSNFRFIDLFAGIGGLRIPFEETELNGDCVFTSEKDQHARNTYLLNFGQSTHEINEDITQFYGGSDEPNRFDEIPDHELLLAGFPCQPFSMAGKRLGNKDERALFDAIRSIVEVKKPRVVLLENVRGLRSIDNGKTFQEILLSLEMLGYFCKWAVLNARDYGLPQNRNRLFIVAIRNEISGSGDYEFPLPTHDRTELCVGDVLDLKPDPKLIISDRLWKGHQQRKARNLANGKGFGFQMVSGDSQYTATLSARYFKDGSEILVAQEASNPRKISVREAARLQGFPESFKFPHSSSQAYKQLGNAVPISVIRSIALSLKSYLTN
jgi:DNA (cytosine-5)-methyltransferase 1